MNPRTPAKIGATDGSDDPQPGCSHYHPEENLPDSSDDISVTRKDSSERLSDSSSLNIESAKTLEEVDILGLPKPPEEVPVTSFGFFNRLAESSSRVTNEAKTLDELEDYSNFIADQFPNKKHRSGRKPPIFGHHISDSDSADGSTSAKGAIYSWSADSMKSYGELERQLTGKRPPLDTGDEQPSDDLANTRCDILPECFSTRSSWSSDSLKSEGQLQTDTEYLGFHFPYKRQRSRRKPPVYIGGIDPDLLSESINPIPEQRNIQDVSSTNERTPREVLPADGSMSPSLLSGTAVDPSSAVESTTENAPSTVEITPGDASSTDDLTLSEQSSAESVHPRLPLREIQLSEMNNPYPDTDQGSEEELIDNDFDDAEDVLPDDFDDEYELDDEGSGSEADSEGMDEGDRGYFQLADRTVPHPSGTSPPSISVGDNPPSVEGPLINIIPRIEENKENINIPALRPLFEEITGSSNRKRKAPRNNDKKESPAKRRRPLTLRI